MWTAFGWIGVVTVICVTAVVIAMIVSRHGVALAQHDLEMERIKKG